MNFLGFSHLRIHHRHLEEAVETRLVVGEVDLLQEALAALLAAVRGLLVLVPEKVFKMLK